MKENVEWNNGIERTMPVRTISTLLLLVVVFFGYGQEYQCGTRPYGQIATSSKTKWIDVKRKVRRGDTATGGINSKLVSFSPQYRATVINSGDQVAFSLIDPNAIPTDAKIHWEIVRQFESAQGLCPAIGEHYLRIEMRNTDAITFMKDSSESCRLFETYIVKLYEGNDLIDCLELFVLGESYQAYKNHFDFSEESEQDEAIPPRHKAAFYPDFSSEFINTSCSDGAIREKINEKSVFTTYNDNSVASRSGNPGTLRMTSPDSSDGSLSFCEQNPPPWEINNRSRNKRNDVIFYPRHIEGSEFYYQVSIMVPSTNDPSFYDDYYNIVFEFHQSTFPVEALRPHFKAIMHLIINGPNKMKINYGLAGIGYCASQDIPYRPGQWIDFTFHIKWKNVYQKSTSQLSSNEGNDGLFECWYDNNKVNFKQARLGQYKLISSFSGGTTIYGPNLDNYNPANIVFNQYRLRRDTDDDNEVPYETSVLFDDFIITKDRPANLSKPK